MCRLGRRPEASRNGYEFRYGRRRRRRRREVLVMPGRVLASRAWRPLGVEGRVEEGQALI
jgi:hypothetical protein